MRLKVGVSGGFPLASGRMRRNTWALVGLAALALVTGVLVLLSFLNVRPMTVEAAPAQSPVADTADETPTPLSSTAPTPSRAPTPSPRAPRESTIANIKQALTGPEPMKILVLGDASGLDDPDRNEVRWVTRWAQELAQQRPVTVAARGGDGTFAEPQRYGPETGAPIEILNASDVPATLAEATAQADTLIPKDVDLVIISFGHREGTTPIAASLDALWGKLPPGAMGMVLAQNPERTAGANAQRDRAWAVLGWAEQKRVPSVDVFNAFIAAPEPLVELLSANRVNPNNRGSEVWRDAVIAALA